MKFLLLIFISIFYLNASSCKNYYNPEKFYEAPDYLASLIEDNLNGLKLFGDSENYLKKGFNKKEDFYLKDIKYKYFNEYMYPQQNGLWKIKIKNSKVDELNIAIVELYTFSDAQIAQEINDNFDEYWNDWIEDGYEMQLMPEQTLFYYKDYYFTFSVYIYGVKADATKLKGTVVNYWFKDYTKEVETYKLCIKK